MTIDWTKLVTKETSEKQAIEDVKGVIASRRYDAETRGVSVNGMNVFTDRNTQMKLIAASVRAGRDPEFSVNWKLSDSSFVTLDSKTLIFLADVVGDYVQACFDREAALLSEFEKGTYTNEMLSEGWPT